MPDDEIGSRGAELISVMTPIHDLSERDARSLIQTLMRKAGTYPADPIEEYTWSKVYVLIRLFVAVPNSLEIPPDGAARWGGGESMGKTNLLWPLTIRRNEVVLTGVFPGCLGPRYDGVKDFDILLERFGKRLIDGSAGGTDSTEEER
jgi:hypothetical protein